MNAEGVVGLRSVPSARQVDMMSGTSVPPMTSPGATPPPRSAAMTVWVYGWCSLWPSSWPFSGRFRPCEVFV